MSWAHVAVFLGLMMLAVSAALSPAVLVWIVLVALAFVYFTWRHDRTPRQ